jgi:hypothetical protein
MFGLIASFFGSFMVSRRKHESYEKHLQELESKHKQDLDEAYIAGYENGVNDGFEYQASHEDGDDEFNEERNDYFTSRLPEMPRTVIAPSRSSRRRQVLVASPWGGVAPARKETRRG